MGLSRFPRERMSLVVTSNEGFRKGEKGVRAIASYGGGAKTEQCARTLVLLGKTIRSAGSTDPSAKAEVRLAGVLVSCVRCKPNPREGESFPWAREGSPGV